MKSPTFRWSEAHVDLDGVLHVVVDNATGEWREEFERIAQRRNQEMRLQPWERIGLAGSTLRVTGVEPGSEGILRDAVEQMLRLAHERSVPLKTKRDAALAEHQTDQSRQVDEAQASQDRFRSFGDQQAPPG